MAVLRPAPTRTSGTRPLWSRSVLLGSTVALLCFTVWAQPAAEEYHVKAAFLLNFVKFVEWPTLELTDTTPPLSICIFGDDPFGTALDQLIAGERVNGRPLAIQRVRRTPVPKSCQAVFFAKSEQEAGKVLTTLGPGVLTVGEEKRFADEGGMIAFFMENRRVRFDIDNTTATKAGLKLSSKLLNVARAVKE